jgi:hypothetical protein
MASLRGGAFSIGGSMKKRINILDKGQHIRVTIMVTVEMAEQLNDLRMSSRVPTGEHIRRAITAYLAAQGEK